MSIPDVFAAQVDLYPDAVALVAGEKHWTYRELDESSNRLAHLLSDHGARAGQSVALLVERSARAIVAILAVLKTGAAYLPIDPPAHPQARIEFMVADSRPPVAAIATAGLADRLDGCDLPILDVDNLDTGTQPGTALPSPAPDDLAHIIYTSGTPVCPKVLQSLTTTSPACSTRWTSDWRCRRGGRSGHSATPTRSTTRCGRSGAHCCTVGAWWWCRRPWRLHQ